MLAYELFLANKKPQARNSKPFKKIIYRNNEWKINDTPLEKYGEESTPFQSWLSMPLRNYDASVVNLPDHRVGNSQPNPYIEIYCQLKITRSSSILVLSIGKKPNDITYSFNIFDQTTKKIINNVTLKLEKKKYSISKTTLFDLYVKTGLIDKHGKISNDEFDKIVNKFFDFVKTKTLENLGKIKNPSFSIFLIPSDGNIVYEQANEQETTVKSAFTDSFGQPATEYPSIPTRSAKFLSADDRSFTLNCKKWQQLYKDIGIGNNSHKRIDLPEERLQISGLTWIFKNIDDSNFKSQDTRQGFFHQLYTNYKKLSNNSSHRETNTMLKVICFKKTQAKIEILVDENLTMDKMKRMFNLQPDFIQYLGFEILIETTKKTKLWNNYLYAIKNFLAEQKLPKNYLIQIFTSLIHKNIHTWLKDNTNNSMDNTISPKDFFNRSDFCIKTLYLMNYESSYMNQSENFAFQIGKIARSYIDFKEDVNRQEKNINNSLKDILTYSKYDREKLRFVFNRIATGINLTKINQPDTTKLDKLNHKITSLYPKEEISDEELHKDFSYFFYKGYYTSLEKDIS